MNASILSAENESLLPFSVTKKCKRTTFEKKKQAHIDQWSKLNEIQKSKCNTIKESSSWERVREPKTNLPEIEKYLPTHKQVKECCLLQQK